MRAFKTLEEMYNSQEYQSFISDKLGNDLFINDPERASRIYDAAEEGIDGSTTQETIDDWREFLDSLKIIDDGEGDITQETYDAISAAIDACEEWHTNNERS